MMMLMFLLWFYPRNLPKKFDQNWVSNKWDTFVVVVAFVVVVVVDDNEDIVFVVVLSQKPSIKVCSKSRQ